MKERLIYIDQMKGIAILIVIMVHLIGKNAGYNEVFFFIFSFIMPLFFMISGYLGHRTTRIDSLKVYGMFLKKKFIALMLPFLFWNLIAEQYFFRTAWHIPSLIDIYNVVILYNRLWFLKTLFIIFIIYGLTNWLSLKIHSTKINFCVDLFLILLFAGGGAVFMKVYPDDAHLFLYSAFFYMGVFISKCQWIEKIMQNQYFFSCCVILFLTWACHWDPEGGYIDKLYKFIISPMTFVVAFYLCRKINWYQKISNQFVMFGKYSLVIYIVHFYLVEFSKDETIIEMNAIILFILSFIVAGMVAYLCIGVAKLIEKVPVLNFLMFGKFKG